MTPPHPLNAIPRCIALGLCSMIGAQAAAQDTAASDGTQTVEVDERDSFVRSDGL